MYVGGLFYTF